jgi:hypothetical protein
MVSSPLSVPRWMKARPRRRLVQRGQVALRRLADVDHGERHARRLELADAALQQVVARRHGEDLALARRGRGVGRRNVEHVDGRVLDAVIDEILHFPAHRALQLGRRHVGCLDQQQLVLAVGQHRGALMALDVQLARAARPVVADRPLARCRWMRVHKGHRVRVHRGREPSRDLASACEPAEQIYPSFSTRNLKLDE